VIDESVSSMPTVSILLVAICAIGLLVPLALAYGPEDVRAVEDESTVDLVTVGRKSGLERRATIWFVTDGGRIYVQSGKDGGTDWYRNLTKNPDVKLELPSRTLAGRARMGEDGEESRRVHELFRKKYWLARLAGWVGGGFGRGRVVCIEPPAN
jgi:deazaflavin-dependent oxidoreductase (nitroreductase family)